MVPRKYEDEHSDDEESESDPDKSLQSDRIRELGFCPTDKFGYDGKTSVLIVFRTERTP